MISSRKKAEIFSLTHFVAEEIDVDKTANRFLGSLARACFFDDAQLRWLIPASCLVLFASIWLMLSPGVIYSSDKTWDLLFNLEGAWRLYTGQVLHVDFHDPLGTLPFAITALGFQLVGIKPIAFVVGECVLAVALMALAIVAVKDRLPTLPGFLFVSMCVELVLVPVTIGDEPSRFTFAMGYNRLGWSAVSILCLLLFIEPRGRRSPVWTDLAAGSVLTVGLFYLKITYFEVAVTAISLALLTSRHVRRHWPGWCGALLLVLLVAFAPMNDGYRADVISAIASGSVRSNPLALVLEFALNGVEQIWVFAEIIILLYLSSQRYATLTDVLFGLFIWISGFFLLTQNAQAALSIPLYTVLALLLYVRLGDWLRSATHRPLMLVSCLMTCALLPLLPPLFSNSLTLIGYNIKARRSSQTFVVTENYLQGLAVPADDDDVLDEVAAEGYARDSFSRIRARRGGHELSQREYVKTILVLADLLRERGAASARVVVIDNVNPLPFVLGAAPPRGGNLWSGDGIARQPPEEALREADYVAIPRFPTQRANLIEGLKSYREYLSTRFVRYETPYWTVLERRNALSRR
jgi:hypothetical protein